MHEMCSITGLVTFVCNVRRYSSVSQEIEVDIDT